MLDKVFAKVLGTKHSRELRRLQPLVQAINAREDALRKLSDDELKAHTARFREQLDQGAQVDSLLIPAFAVCREAARRVLGMRHYDVQLIGGIVLHEGKIAEMKTGEGKTLVATLPCYLNALEGRGVHVVTVNDYLASRDAEWMGKLHGFLGLSTGVIASQQGESAKKRAYQCDITYGQNNEFGFDYLRDNMKFSIYDYAQRELHYAIVDEVDSILVDEARTPLIISGPGETASDKYMAVDAVMTQLRNEEHFVVDEKNHSVTLTELGMETAQDILYKRGLTEVENLYDPVNLETLHILQQSLKAHTLYKRDQHYMVSPEGRVMIIDEFTGRVLPGRRWSDGLHQAVEAKEHVPIEDENITLATISFQNLFRLYNKLSGMTGTADTEAPEFHSIYKLDVVVIPTNKPIAREDFDDVVFLSEKEKFHAIADEIREGHEAGQPVLVGTTSVEKSDVLSRILDKKGIPHNVLNAKQHEREAYVVAQAGRKGAVTVATNMAGRGTDIVLGGNPAMLARMDVLEGDAELAGPAGLSSDAQAIETAVQERLPRFEAQCAAEKQAVLDAGGLHIVGTERHESRRIDNQLRGRSGRQGDPGSSRFFLSFEDDLMRIFGGQRLQNLMSRIGMREGEPIESKSLTKVIENSQRRVEERNFDIRKNMLEYDDVLNQQRKSVYALRRQILMGQFRTVPSDEQRKKGIEPKPLVKTVDTELAKSSEVILGQMVRIHSAPMPGKSELSPEEQRAWRQTALEAEIQPTGEVRYQNLQREVYLWFGCRCELRGLRNQPQATFDLLKEEVAWSLSEQKERMLDLTDERVGAMVEHACPRDKHFEDWDLEGLATAYKEQFGIEATGIDSSGDAQEIASKLYNDAEAVLLKKFKDFGRENFLRLFRNFAMQEIDQQWIQHLQNMDQLRDGIGLRGYGQRDPKKEYKKEGFLLFQQMMQSVKSSVLDKLFHVEQVRQEDLERLEAQRREQSEERERQTRARHLGDGGQEEAQQPNLSRAYRRALRRNQPRSVAVPNNPATDPQTNEQRTLRRERPKVGRNDPCWCGSGKKYKQCHYRADQSAAATS